MNKADLKHDIIKGIDIIKSLDDSEYSKVSEIYSVLSKRFLNCKEIDFQCDKRIIYKSYRKCLLRMKETYKDEMRRLSNKDVYFTSGNFFQIKVSLLSYLDWLEVI